MTRQRDPRFSKRQLGRLLRTFREQAGKTQPEVATRMDWSVSKLTRIEKATVGISTTDLRALLAEYDMTDEELITDLTAVAKESREQPWYAPYDAVTTEPFRRLLAYEGSAVAIHQFHPLLIPGLLQTREYALAVLANHYSGHELELALEARMQRQARQAADPARLVMLIDEGAVRREIGGPEVLRAQLRALLTRAAEPATSIRVVPFTAGAHHGLSGGFMLLELDEEISDTVLFEETAGKDYLANGDSDVVTTAWERFLAIEQTALSEPETAALLAGLVTAN
ncbi:helix-turn-helix transcriptional regulator [Actinokineospora auranticolor]|uniref:Helix-turn-helix protein n=1 Tax=Actinokineospora auranticolor TaxID=155976 RepID=A0A2S6GYR0_9PSEU|nr:helix-turn-helix transcriptional regulator [Actinokineospora auranticolor]PPK70300.1 helix-turn-helix protein [Actinokineospora auranticolor]